MKSKTASNLLLLLTAFIWGSAFVAQKAGTVLESFTYNGIRTLIAGVFLLIVIGVSSAVKKNKTMSTATDMNGEFAEKRALVEKKAATIKGGIACGIVLAVASTLQQYGMFLGTDAGKAGFITALYIVMVPLLGIFIGQRPRKIIWLCVILGAFGFYMLTMFGTGTSLSLGKGEVMLLLCAFFFSVHIQVVDHFAERADAIKMSCLQFFVCAAICLVGMAIFEHPEISAILSVWFPIIYAGVFSAGLGYTFQIIAQKNADPATASLIMSLESVFAVLTGAVILHERMTVYEILGCIIIFAAVILAQLPAKQKQTF
ncbi:MAG: DMT family transporter [Eubacterium sp.]